MTPTVTADPWQVPSSELPSAADSAGTLAFLLRFAVLAPSGHNTQPWLFRARGETLDVFADRAQALAVVDPDDRELTISCGTALLNLRVALRRFAYRDDAFELLPEADTPDLLASVRLVAGAPPSVDEEALFLAVGRRRTTRAAYSSRAVPAAVEVGHGGRHPQMVLRVGEGPDVRAAARKPVDDVLVDRMPSGDERD